VVSGRIPRCSEQRFPRYPAVINSILNARRSVVRLATLSGSPPSPKSSQVSQIRDVLPSGLLRKTSPQVTHPPSVTDVDDGLLCGATKNNDPVTPSATASAPRICRSQGKRTDHRGGTSHRESLRNRGSTQPSHIRCDGRAVPRTLLERNVRPRGETNDRIRAPSKTPGRSGNTIANWYPSEIQGEFCYVSCCFPASFSVFFHRIWSSLFLLRASTLLFFRFFPSANLYFMYQENER
jgi:hypothetical protein